MTQPKFLVVEDDQDLNNLLCAMLGSLGCETVSAVTGEQALEFMDSLENALSLDAIFLDIYLPGVNGMEILQQLKDRMYTEKIPVIIMSAKSDKEDLMKGYNTGADYFIPKPFTLQQITYALDIVLGTRDESEGDDSANS